MSKQHGPVRVQSRPRPVIPVGVMTRCAGYQRSLDQLARQLVTFAVLVAALEKRLKNPAEVALEQVIEQLVGDGVPAAAEMRQLVEVLGYAYAATPLGQEQKLEQAVTQATQQLSKLGRGVGKALPRAWGEGGDALESLGEQIREAVAAALSGVVRGIELPVAEAASPVGSMLPPEAHALIAGWKAAKR